MSTIGGPGGIGGPKGPGGPEGPDGPDGPDGPGDVDAAAAGRAADAGACRCLGRDAGIEQAGAASRAGDIDALAAEIAAGRLTPHEAIERLVDEPPAPELGAAERAELRELLDRSRRKRSAPRRAGRPRLIGAGGARSSVQYTTSPTKIVPRLRAAGRRT